MPETASAEPLGHPFSDEKRHFDVIVVGSGYGASVCAARLAEAGLDVCVLERGREYTPGRFRKTDPSSSGRFPGSGWEALGECQADWHNLVRWNPLGLYDLRIGSDFDMLVGCGLGGTSLINAGVSVEPEPEVWGWQAWPVEIREAARLDPCLGAAWPEASPAPAPAPGVPDDRPLSYYFALARAMLRPVPLPDAHAPPRLDALAEAVRAVPGGDLRRADINVNFSVEGENHAGALMRPCVRCGDCVSGCNFEAKNALVENYLPLARRFGATLFTRCDVDVIEREDEGHGEGALWRVRFHHRPGDGPLAHAVEHAFSARAVVLGAGSLGSTEILLRSRERSGLGFSSLLGARFSSNGDLATFAYDTREEMGALGTGRDERPSTHAPGPTIVGLADVSARPAAPGRVLIQDGVIPRALVWLARIALPLLTLLSRSSKARGLLPRLRKVLRDFRDRRRALRRTLVFLSIGHDGAAGRIELGPNGRAAARWEHPRELPLYRRTDEMIHEMIKKLHGDHLRSPLWSRRAGSQLITVHPLGGCPMGDHAGTGAVDHAGRVFVGDARDPAAVHPGLYVADGAVMPVSLGVNPLLTITALAERIAEHAARDLGRPLAGPPTTCLPRR